MNRNLGWIAEAPKPTQNDHDIHSHSSYADLFNQEVPDEVEGFECEDREKMKITWPEGHSVAKEVRYEDHPSNCNPPTVSNSRRFWIGSYAQRQGLHSWGLRIHWKRERRHPQKLLGR